MLKHFRDMPTEFEQYNPASYMEHSSVTKTFDENGLLHSYDDKPSSVEFGKHSYRTLKWHSHGKLHRANGEPPMISFSSNQYITFNEQELRHSYNDMPSSLHYGEGTWISTWEKEEQVHRSNNKPANIAVQIFDLDSDMYDYRREVYYVDGKRHRGGGLPSEIVVSNSWQVEDSYVDGILHNVNGLASAFQTKGVPGSDGRWSLYGVEVSETFFKEFTQIKHRTTFPSWVAFLIVLDQITEDELTAVYNQDINWDQSQSILWLLRALGITELGFRASLNKAIRNKLVINLGNHESIGERSLFQILIAIASFEATESTVPSQKRESVNV